MSDEVQEKNMSTETSSPTKQTGMSPKLSFAVGLLSAVAVLSLIGFIVLLSRGDSKKGNVEGEGQQVAEQEQEQEKEPEAPPAVDIPVVTNDDHIRGSIDAKVKVVEYSDLLCPFCKKHHATMKQLVEAYSSDEVAWVFRHFPLPSLHPEAPKFAEATECAAELGGNEAFWSLADKISEDDSVTLDSLGDTVVALGLDKAKFQECLDSGKYSDAVQAQYQEAMASGGQGTPFNVIVGPDGKNVPLPGAYPLPSFQEVVDGLLAE